ncbi:chaperonin GroEL, partial [Reticulomyxa filosa]
LGERLGKLSSGVAVFRVGGRQDVVIGGGIALLYSAKILDSVEFDNEDQRVCIDIVRKVVQLPAIAIIRNSGKEGSVFAGKMLENSKADSRYGYHCATDQWSDLHKLGVIDPFKMVRTVLQDAASVASLMTTTEAVITELPKRDAPKMNMRGVKTFWTWPLHLNSTDNNQKFISIMETIKY